MLTPSNKLGRRCDARLTRHAIADAAVYVAAILAAVVAVAARARALSPGSHPTRSPQEPRPARRFLDRPSVNEVPAEYHLMTGAAAASRCPQVVNISYSDYPAAAQPLPWGAATIMVMPVAKKICSTRVWYVAPTSTTNSPYKLNSKPDLSNRMSQSTSLELVLLMLGQGARGFLPLLGWTDGTSEDLPAECRAWLTPRSTFWAFFIAGLEPVPLLQGPDSYGTVPAGARGALLSIGTGRLCGYVEPGTTSSTPPPASGGEAERMWTPTPTAAGTDKDGSLSSAAWRVTAGIGIGSSLVAVVAVAAGVAAVWRRLPAIAEARDTSDGDRTDQSGCPRCVGGYGADVGVSYRVHAAGEVVTDAAGGGADHGAAGVVAYDRALDGSMVGSIGDDVTVDGLFCNYPPRAAPAARRPSDTTQSIGSSDGGAPVSSLSDHMDVDGLVREVLQLPTPPPPP